jgi:hypothetical protein
MVMDLGGDAVAARYDKVWPIAASGIAYPYRAEAEVSSSFSLPFLPTPSYCLLPYF